MITEIKRNLIISEKLLDHTKSLEAQVRYLEMGNKILKNEKLNKGS